MDTHRSSSPSVLTIRSRFRHTQSHLPVYLLSTSLSSVSPRTFRLRCHPKDPRSVSVVSHSIPATSHTPSPLSHLPQCHVPHSVPAVLPPLSSIPSTSTASSS
ncbi:hypothetical protein EJ05DRAFT_118502 [Pseudovirgaria hyperparasitica]|uniref:Uncharacterized protein n=1 Tax=Pseudovirgaria hyperparasitica TaxID=470096 RepID=A0A6A6VYQ1_9PEZI|nr:uncharacterized protein EJ05DRAFT_118502 [Pseudovirgaria hyperparasitica]KAF2754989.1 hypothetical protein EJ05DRAFT_118502 [Pseudovirgaria hyperparasitica]